MRGEIEEVKWGREGGGEGLVRWLKKEEGVIRDV